jgi:hypothetical protein
MLAVLAGLALGYGLLVQGHFGYQKSPTGWRSIASGESLPEQILARALVARRDSLAQPEHIVSTFVKQMDDNGARLSHLCRYRIESGDSSATWRTLTAESVGPAGLKAEVELARGSAAWQIEYDFAATGLQIATTSPERGPHLILQVFHGDGTDATALPSVRRLDCAERSAR